MNVKSSKSIQKVPTGYHLAYSDKTMLPQGAKWSNRLTRWVSGWSKHIQGVPGQLDTFKPHFWIPFSWNWQNHVTTGHKSKQNCPIVSLVEFQVDPSPYRVSNNNWLLLNLIFGYLFDIIDKSMLPKGINQREMAQLFDSLSFRLIQAHTGCPRSIWYF